MNNFFKVIYKTLEDIVKEGYKEVKFTISETKRLHKERKTNGK